MTENTQNKKGLKRRKFLKYTGAGIGLMIGGAYFTRHMWRRSIAEMAEKTIVPYMGNSEPTVWLQVTPENEVILHSSKVEMGQGTFTSLAQIAADELDVDYGKMKVVHAESASGNVDQFATGGSMSIASLWEPMREIAATMREMIKAEAAKKMGVEASTLSTANGVVSGGGKSMTYGEVVDGVTDWDIPDTPPLRDVSEYKFVGKPMPRVDLVDKVVGAPIFGMDAEMPDMLFGSVIRPAKVDAKLKSWDFGEAEKMPGVVKVVKDGDLIGVVAESMIQATVARRKIKTEWEVNQKWDMADIDEMIKVGAGEPFVIQKEGDAKDLLDGSGETIEMEFKSPIGAHAQLEPNGSVALVKDGKATVILSTQVVEITRKEVAERLGLDKENVNIIPTFLGGGFGRRLNTITAMEAAVFSKAVGRPVKCFYDRQQEFQNDQFRPPTHHLLRAKLTDGKIEAIEHNVSSGDVMYGEKLTPPFVAPIIGADIGAWRGGMIMYRDIPNIRTVSWRVKLPFATRSWRSLGLLANTFAIESFIDELAIKAGKNPVDFRLAHIQNDKAGDRLKAVIEAAAKKAGYNDQPIGNRAMGFAASTDTTSPCAHVAEVSIEDGEIKVHKVTCAFDCGLAVNPDQVKAQCEGCINMGISAAMYERMVLKNNELHPIIYGPYRMALMRDTPNEIDVVLIQGDDKPGPVGEPPLGPIGAAIGNAVRRLTGKRLTEMPLAMG